MVRHAATLAWDLGETKGTVAVRMPLDPVALAVLDRTGPLAVSSANRTAWRRRPTPPRPARQLGTAVEVYLDGGTSGDPVASTILDLTGETPTVLREGAVSRDELPHRHPGAGMTFRVLHVCTGNICRSPMAEHLMRAGLRERLGAGRTRSRSPRREPWASPATRCSRSRISTLRASASTGRAFVARELSLEPDRGRRPGAGCDPRAPRDDRDAEPQGDPAQLHAARVRPTGQRRRARATCRLQIPRSAPPRWSRPPCATAGWSRRTSPRTTTSRTPSRGPEAGYVACARLVQTRCNARSTSSPGRPPAARLRQHFPPPAARS